MFLKQIFEIQNYRKMKKYFLPLIMLFALSFAVVDAHAQFAQDITFSGRDTVVNTDTVTLTLALKKSYQTAVFTLSNTKVSGTAAGKTYFEAKASGTNWVILDSLLHTDIALNEKMFLITPPTYTNYRFRVIGTGTMAMIANAVATVRRF
jgi:hypothetical protein